MNDLQPQQCLDQGPQSGNTPIMYPCHSYSSQVCARGFVHDLPRGFPRWLLNFALPTQLCYYRSNGQIYVGGIKSHKYSSNRCLVDPGSSVKPGLYECKMAEKDKYHMLWDFKLVKGKNPQRVEQNVLFWVKSCEVNTGYVSSSEWSDPEQRDKEMFGGHHRSGRLCQSGCAEVQRPDLENTTRH